MAKATPRTREKLVTETVARYKQVPNGVTLELSDDEAQALVTIFYKVGGSPTDSGRGKCDAISAALRAAGYNRDNSKYRDRNSGNFYFRDDPA